MPRCSCSLARRLALFLYCDPLTSRAHQGGCTSVREDSAQQREHRALVSIGARFHEVDDATGSVGSMPPAHIRFSLPWFLLEVRKRQGHATGDIGYRAPHR